MREWVEGMTDAGAKIAGAEGVIVNNTPDDTALKACQVLGTELAK